MKSISPWAAAAIQFFAKDTDSIFERTIGDYIFSIYHTPDAVWISSLWPNGGKAVFRAAFSPGGEMQLLHKKVTANTIVIHLSSAIGHIKTEIQLVEDRYPVLRYTTSLTPDTHLNIPFWPRDILFPGKEANALHITGKVHVKQAGTRSGLLYASMTRPKSGSILYLQNLTALADYCQQTVTSCKEVVGGDWPELGFSLPPGKDKFLEKGKCVVISDAIVGFESRVPNTEQEQIHQYLDMLAALYIHMPRPGTHYKDWPDILQKGLKDLIHNHGCWSDVEGTPYLNAYVCDYQTPPEIMVQLAVLLPLLDYVEWSKQKLEVMQQIRASISSFYDDRRKTIMRWLPAASHRLEGEEEQKEPLVMDSWYLHHPLLNISRLALKGDKEAGKLFLQSLDFAIKVARHFKYRWPVFYNIDTLEVVKEETSPGKGGEKDVAGIYTHIMLQAWELTGERKYLLEAEKAAKTLQGMGFDLFYQANNTAFSAGALLRLSKITGKKLYLELSYTCLANVFRNVQLWDCNYGFGKNFPTFFALFPLNDAPYTAVYEEQEVFCALHDYLQHAGEEDLLPSLRLLCCEYIRYLIDRAPFYYPPMLPPDMLSAEVKIGEVVPGSWVALEDLHDGWEKSGSVGQEVYGAGNAFGILPRHYHQVPDKNLLIYLDYPVQHFSYSKKKGATFFVIGSEKIACSLRIINTGKGKLPAVLVSANGHQPLMPVERKAGYMAYTIYGNQEISIQFPS
jgi:hypothetical protein